MVQANLELTVRSGWCGACYACLAYLILVVSYSCLIMAGFIKCADVSDNNISTEIKK